MENKKIIRSFRDLDVYQNASKACKIVFEKILPKIPKSEEKDLRDQLSRSSKAVPRLISEGYAKKHQVKGFQKYLDDAHAESNETIVGLEQCVDLYNIEPIICRNLIDLYDKISRQLYKLALAWDNFNNDRKAIKPKSVKRITLRAALPLNNNLLNKSK